MNEIWVLNLENLLEIENLEKKDSNDVHKNLKKDKFMIIVMLQIPYKYVLKSGFYFNGKFILYKYFTFKKVINMFYGISKYRFLLYFKRLELQLGNNKYKIRPITSEKYIYFYKIINFYILKILPIYYKFSSLRNLYIIRKWKINSYEGLCHKIGKPVHGQRTWSNASTAKNNNLYLRSYLKEKHRTRKSKRLKDQWQ